MGGFQSGEKLEVDAQRGVPGNVAVEGMLEAGEGEIVAGVSLAVTPFVVVVIATDDADVEERGLRGFGFHEAFEIVSLAKGGGGPVDEVGVPHKDGVEEPCGLKGGDIKGKAVGVLALHGLGEDGVKDWGIVVSMVVFPQQGGDLLAILDEWQFVEITIGRQELLDGLGSASQVQNDLGAGLQEWKAPDFDRGLAGGLSRIVNQENKNRQHPEEHDDGSGDGKAVQHPVLIVQPTGGGARLKVNLKRFLMEIPGLGVGGIEESFPIFEKFPLSGFLNHRVLSGGIGVGFAKDGFLEKARIAGSPRAN